MKEKPAGEVKVSVVIPVYNAEKYISHLIRSLKAQTLTDLEFIFVDDCGEDASMSFVLEWAAEDPRVRVLQNEANLGEGVSRNKGMAAARGTYVNNIDPDDWVAEDYYELLYNKALCTSADMVKGTRVTISEEAGKPVERKYDLNKEIAASLDKGEPLYLRLAFEHQTVLFKHSLMDEGIKYGKSGNAADTTFLLKLCSKAHTFALENRAKYYYLKRKTSATGEYSLKRSKNELVSLREFIDYFLQKKAFDEYAYRYLAKSYRNFADRFIYARESTDISEYEKRKFIADFKAQFTRIPGHAELYRLEPRIFALIELDIMLTNVLSKDISLCKGQIAEWMTYVFAIDGPQRRDALIKLMKLLKSCKRKRKEDGASDNTIREEISQMAAGLETIRQKLYFYGIVEYLSIRHFLGGLKARTRLLFKD